MGFNVFYMYLEKYETSIKIMLGIYSIYTCCLDSWQLYFSCNWIHGGVQWVISSVGKVYGKIIPLVFPFEFSSWELSLIFRHVWFYQFHGAGIYANMTGVYWWDPCYHIYHTWILWDRFFVNMTVELRDRILWIFAVLRSKIIPWIFSQHESWCYDEVACGLWISFLHISMVWVIHPMPNPNRMATVYESP